MYGKHFESMYTGSMVGRGALTFALWGYVISHQKPPGFDVELNPVILQAVLGEPTEAIVECINAFCEPDPRSRSKAEEGRKLLRRGEYLFHVVNGEEYHAIRTNEERRQYWRDQKKRQRAGGVAETGNGETPRAAFTKPSIEEIKLHGAKIGLPDSECEKFHSYYESNGWKVGKNPMKSWHSAMATWRSNWRERQERERTIKREPKFNAI